MIPFWPIAVIVGLATLHVCLCLYALFHAGDVAEVLARPQRTLEAWAYMYALRQWSWDSESDLVGPGLSPEIVQSNIRSRATLGAFLGAIPLAVALYMLRTLSAGAMLR